MEKAKNSPFSMTTEDGLFDIHVSYTGYMTMIDGKVAKALTHCPSYNRCPLCHYQQSEFKNYQKFDTIDDNIKFGLRWESSQIASKLKHCLYSLVPHNLISRNFYTIWKNSS